jgi:hopene-associated glycosyltransferase HpnB
VYLLTMRGRFWRVRLESTPTPEQLRTVTAVVPARNEADVVGTCIESLLRQTGVEINVIVIDDASTDSTAAQVRTAAQRCGSPDRLTVLHGSPLPPGWTGKLWAIHQGIAQGTASRPDYLLLTDADVEHGPDSIATLISLAERDSFDLTSYMVKLRCESLAEKLLIPAFVYFFFQLYPPAYIADPSARTAGAAGGCILLRPSALAKAGGIESIRAEIIDDCALADRVKRSGGRLWLGLTDRSRSLRSYGTFAEVGRMISRTAFNQLDHSSLLLLATVLGLLLTYFSPLALVCSGSYWPMLFGGAAWAMMTASYVPMVRFYGLNPLWSLTLPLTALFYMGATVWSAVQFWRGRGGQWKGRTQDRAEVTTR